MSDEDLLGEAPAAARVPKVVKPTMRDPRIKRWVHLDYETYSEADLSKTGASVYARHESTEVLMLAFRLEGEEYVQQWVPAEGEEMPAELRGYFEDPRTGFLAWNAPFEMAITWWTLGLKVATHRWRDVMALALSLSLPGKLEKAGAVIGLDESKAKLSRGSALVRKFCKPRKPTKNKPHTRATAETDPEDWIDFLEYNRQDVIAEAAILRRIRKWMMPEHEWDLWHLDQKINNAGIPINRRAVRAAQRLSDITIKKDMAKLREITGLANPNSNAQILPWLNDHGYPYEDLKKAHVERAYDMVCEMDQEDRDLLGFHPLLSEVLRLRLRVSKASVKKFAALEVATDEDGVLRGCHQFAGAARTWRWSGRRFQPQNLPKPEKYLEKIVEDLAWEVEHLDPQEIAEKHENPMDVLTAVVRPMVQAPEGHLLVDADLSAIENVVVGWLARDERILKVFWENRDPYIDFATRMFGMSYEEIAAEVEAGDKSKRTIAKPGVLGCGYMLGAGEEKENKKTGEMEATGLLGYGRAMNVDLSPEMSALSVKVFRDTYEGVTQFWNDLDKAVRKLIHSGETQKVGYLTIDKSGPFMRIILPSGRALHYLRPRLEQRRMPWKDKNGKPVYRLSITYENQENGQWRRVTTHPGKLTENVVQAVARDLLAHGMTLADARGIDIRMHVHDQIVGVAPRFEAEEQLETLIECMTTVPDWADDKLPLKAAGAVTPVFLKD